MTPAAEEGSGAHRPHAQTDEAVLTALGSDAQRGLTDDEARARLARYGRNELAAEARQRPGKLKASGTAFGGIWHVGLAGWLTAAGCRADDITWIPINGAGPSLQDLIAGGVDLVCCSVPEASTLLAAGEIRCLGIMAEERLAALPEVPTLQEQGYDWSLLGWRGLALPREVPGKLVVIDTSDDPTIGV